MKNEKIKEGFSAYEEIQGLARRAYPGIPVHVESALISNNYTVEAGSTVVIGSSQTVRAVLLAVIAGGVA